ncbi:trypsin-like serine protease [Ramicandelaber brevisporus]|nr:trypsin-like serine protease [Ramicandelaber brevisporus]
MLFAVLLATVLLALFGSYTATAAPLTPHIINGVSVAENEAPFAAYLNATYDAEPLQGSICTGSIISDRHVLTTAHCIRNIDPKTGKLTPNIKTMQVYAGHVNRTLMLSSSSYRYDVSKMFFFSDFLPDSANSDKDYRYSKDIALLEIDGKFNVSRSLQPIKIGDGSKLGSMTSLTVAGFGVIKFGSHVLSGTLQKAKYTMLDNEVCKRDPESWFEKDGAQLCAIGGSNPVNSGACSGDSGGPVYVNARNARTGEAASIMVGMTAAGPDYCNHQEPDILINPYFYLDFITQVTGINGDDLAVNVFKKSNDDTANSAGQ